MWGQWFSEFIALAFIAMSCGTFLIGVCCFAAMIAVIRLLKIWNEVEQ